MPSLSFHYLGSYSCSFHPPVSDGYKNKGRKKYQNHTAAFEQSQLPGRCRPHSTLRAEQLSLLEPDLQEAAKTLWALGEKSSKG